MVMDTRARTRRPRCSPLRLRRLVAGASLAALVLAGACAGDRGKVHPVDPGQLATEPGWIVAAPTPEIRQRIGAECGAAALAMVAGRWMVPMTLDDALEVTPVSTDLRTSDLKDSAHQLGLDSYTTGNDADVLEFELRAHRPVIVGLERRLGKETFRHYEVVVGLNPTTGQVVTIDPAHGWRVRQLGELDAEWSPLGRPALVVVGRSDEFQEIKPRPKRRVVVNVADRHRPEAWP
jgi:ABC-type bacteriocin/lantibiotic exporter with double-glycine peptidase domain